MDGFEITILLIGGAVIAVVVLAVLVLPKVGPDPDGSFYESGAG